MSPVPELTDGVVLLRAFRPSDVPGMIAMGSDPTTTRWTTAPVPYQREHAEHWMDHVVADGWRDGTHCGWAVEALDGDTPRFAGNMDLRGIDLRDDAPDIGFATAPWARGRGVTTRAVRLATRWGFAKAGLPVVHWSAHAGNVASWRVAHACGFTFDGERPLSLVARGELHDGWFASLRPGDSPSPRTTWWPTPELVGKRVRLRPHTDADVARMVAACTDERTRRWLVHLADPYTADSARAAIRRWRLEESRGMSVNWAVADLHDDRMLANISMFRMDDVYNPTGGEVGYWAHPDARGHGIVGEALDLLIAHAFTPVAEGGLGRHRLHIGAAWTNTASRHVAERAGFTLVGHYRQDGLIGRANARTYDDGAWYDLLATDRRR